MSYNNLKAWYIDSVNYAAITAWSVTAAKTVGQFVRQVSPAVGSERVFVCTAAGTTAGTEPVWVLTVGAKQPLDGTVQWYECTGAAGMNGDATNVSAWTDAQIKGVAQTVGQVIRNVGNGTASYFLCTTAGTPSATTEPTWNTTAGVTTADGTATWTCLGPQSGFSPFGAPAARLEIGYTQGTASNLAGIGSNYYVASSHTQTVAATVSFAAPNVSATICVGKTHAPPTSADETTGASVANTGIAVGLTLSGGSGGSAYYQGMTFSCGSGAATGTFNICGVSNFYKNCSLILGGTGNQAFIQSSGRVITVLDNTTVTFGGTGQGFTLSTGFRWRNTPNALLGTLPTSPLFSISQCIGVLLEGVDLSALASTTALIAGSLQYGLIVIKDCKLASGQKIETTGFPSAVGGAECTIIRSDSGATNYRTEKYSYPAVLLTETVVVRTGGASDGTTAQSWSITSTANASWITPFEAFPIVTWNGITATNRNVTIEGIADPRAFAALPNNDDVWIDVEYLGSAATPLGSWKTGTKTTRLGANAALTASTQLWDSLATARANSTAYVVGNIRKTATCPGMLFVVTAITGTGTTAGSEPAGFTGAVDGQAIVDNPGANQVTWTAMWRFKQTLTLSSPQPGMAGPITAYPKVAKASAIVYLDPLLTLS